MWSPLKNAGGLTSGWTITLNFDASAHPGVDWEVGGWELGDWGELGDWEGGNWELGDWEEGWVWSLG